MGTPLADQLVEILTAGRVGAVFGVPGGQTLPLYGAARAAELPHVVMRDERNAACAADAYARLSGGVGVCDATMGPGVTNLISGLAEAYAASTPVLAVVADIRTDLEHLRERSVASQAVDQRSLLAPVTKWVGRVHRPEALDDVLDHALRLATTGRSGPVAVEIPEDVFTREIGDTAGGRREFDPSSFEFPRFRPAPGTGEIAAAADLLATAERPVVLAGGGALLSRAAGAVEDLAERHRLPVVTSLSGKGVVDERGPWAGGVAGVFGNARASDILRHADVVLVLGSKLAQLTTHGWRLPGPDQRVVQVDTDPAELGRTARVEVPVLADVREAVAALSDALADRRARAGNWVEGLSPVEPPGTADDDPLAPPEQVAATIGETLDLGDVLVCDASLASGWGGVHAVSRGGGRGFLAPRGLGGLGWSGGAAIGARLALDAERRLVVLVGDGGWAYSLAEVETASRLGLDITYVVLNNGSLAWIRHIEDQIGMPASPDFVDTDFAAVARAMGAAGHRTGDVGEFRELLRSAVTERGPTLIDVASSALASPIVSLGKLARGVYAGPTG